MNWHKVHINATQIETQTNKAVLINLPKKSDFAGYSFWHPAKLVREAGGKGYFKSISFTDMWEFKAKKGNHEIRLTPTQVRVAFGSTDEGVGTSLEEQKRKNDSSYLRVAKPEKINKDVEIDECLTNN